MEAGTLQQMQMKKKKMKHNLCYVGLVVLIILLLTPPLLRLFVSDDSGEETKKVIYMALNCTKEDESISSTFADGVPQNIMYSVKGNLLDNAPDEIDNNLTENENVAEVDSSVNTTQDIGGVNNEGVGNEQTTNSSSISESVTVREIFRTYKNFEYDANENISVIRLNEGEIKSVAIYAEELSTINKQENIYTSRGFSCVQSQF